MDAQATSATHLLNDLLTIQEVDAAVVIGRDGFVIEQVGKQITVELDALGASIAGAVMRLEKMGQELQIEKFRDMFIEYGDALLLCSPIGDAILTVLASDASSLGMLRFKLKKIKPELVDFF